MKLATPFMIALAPFVATPSHALQLKPVSADVRQPKGIPAAIVAATTSPRTRIEPA